MEKIYKKQQRTIGAIVKIPLKNGSYTYARILDDCLAFYDAKTRKELSLNEIIIKPVLFITEVYNYAITKGYWLKVGKILPIEKHLQELPPQFIQNPLNPDIFEIVYKNKRHPASKEECK